MGVAQLIDRSFTTLEISGSSPAIDKFFFFGSCIEKTRIKKNGPIFIIRKLLVKEKAIIVKLLKRKPLKTEHQREKKTLSNFQVVNLSSNF